MVRTSLDVTKYGMSDDRLFVEKGLFNVRGMEVRLYRILISAFSVA